MSNKTPERATFMAQVHKDKMGSLPRTHANCADKTGVMRPGKTAKDRYMRSGKYAS